MQDFKMGIGVEVQATQQELQKQIDKQARNIKVKLNADTTEIQDTINKLSKGLKNIDVKVDSSTMKQVAISYSEAAKTGKKIETINAQLVNQYGQLLSTQQKFNAETGELISAKTQIIQKTQTETQELNKQSQQLKQQATLINQMSKADTKLKLLNMDYGDIEQFSSRIRSLQSDLSSVQGVGNLDEQKAKWAQISNSIQLLNKEISIFKQNANLENASKQQQNLADKLDIVRNRADGASKSFNAYLSTLKPKALNDYSTEINKISQSFDKAGKSGQQIDLSMANSQMNSFKGTMKETGMEAKTFLGTLSNNVGKFTQWLVAGNLLMSVFRSFKDGVQFIGEMDKALTNINYTMDVSNNQLKDIGMSSIQMAKDLKTSASNILQAVTIYANANETAESILNKAQPTIMLSNVTGMSSSETADILQGTLEQFDLAEDNLLHISDVFQTVSQSMNVDFAKGIKEIAEGIQASGSVADDAGISLENYVALLGTLISKTRQSGSELGRSLRTMIVRTTKASSSAIASGEVSTDDISKAESVLKSVGVQVRDTVDSFRDFDDIMYDLYKNIDNISQVDLSAIAYEVAGTRQTAQFRLMIKSYADYLELAEKANDSSGTSLQNQVKYAESLQASYESLKTSMLSVWNTTIDSETIKSLVDFTTMVFNTIDAVGGLVPVLGTLAGAFGVHKILIPLITKQMSALLLAETGVTASTMKQIVAQTGLNGAFTLGGTAVKSFITSMLPLLGMAAIIGGIAIAYDTLNVSLKEQREITDDLQSEYDKLQTELLDVDKELSTVSDRIDELNDKDNLTFVEQDELDKLKETNDLLETQKRLLEEQALNKQREVADSIATEFQKDMNDNTKERTYWTGDTTQVAARGEAVTAKQFVTTNEEEYALNMIKLIDQYNDKRERGVELSEEEQSYYEEIRKELVDIGVKYGDYADRYKIDDETSQSWRDFSELIDKTINPESYQRKLFDDVYNSETFGSAKRELEKLAKAGQLTPEVLNSTEEYRKLLEETGFTAEEVSSHINAIANETTGLPTSNIENVNKAMSDLQDTVDSLPEKLADIEEMQDNLNDGYSYSYEQLEELRKKYPELESAIYRTADGWAIEKEAVDLLYGSVTDLSVQFQNAEALMTDFVASETAKRLEAYGIEIKTLQDLANFRAGDEMRKQQELGIGKQSLSTMNPELWAELQTYQSALSKIDELKGRVSDITGGGVRGTDAQKNGSSNSSNSAKESTFSNQIDWAKESLDKLNKSVSDFESTINDSKAYSQQIEDIKTLITLQKNLESGYKKQAKTYESEFNESINGLDKKYVDRIKNGDSFDIQDFKGLSDGNQEKLYNQIVNAQSTYEQWQDALDNINATAKDITDNTQKLADIKFQAKLEPFQNQADTINKTLSELDEILEYVDENSIEQIALLQTGYEQASESLDNYTDQIELLEKQYKKGKVSEAVYLDTLEDLTNQLGSARTAMKDYKDSIVEAITARYDSEKDAAEELYNTTLKDLEESYNDSVDALDNQLKAWNKIIDAKKRSNAEDEKRRQYEQDVTKQTNEIVKIQSRMADLKKAVDTNDRSATKEYNELQDQLAEKEQNLADTQHEYELDLQDDALDKQLDGLEELFNAKKESEKQAYELAKTNAQSEYDTKLTNINKLYETENQLIIAAAQLTQDKFTEVFNALNGELAKYGMSVSSDLSSALTSTNKVINTTASTSSVASILGNKNEANKYADTSSLSGLNKYIASQGYETVSKKQMVQLAQAMGLNDIDTEEKVGTDDIGRTNKYRILDALKNARFAKTGSVDASGVKSSFLKSIGEDGLVAARSDEIILDNYDSDTFRKFVPLMKDMTQAFKSNLPDFSKINNKTTNNSPTVNINLTGNVTPEMKPIIDDWTDDIKDIVGSEFKKIWSGR